MRAEVLDLEGNVIAQRVFSNEIIEGEKDKEESKE
jgi:hypothetical protein